MKNRLSLLVLMLTFICHAASGQKNNNTPKSTTPTEISLQDSIQSLRANNADLRKQLDRMEKEVDRYSEYVKTNTSSIENKITWWLGILTAIITIVVGGLGVVAPYLLNRRSGINANKAKTQAENALGALQTAQNDLSTIKKQVDNARSQAIDAAAEATIAKNSLSAISTKIEKATDNATNAAKKAKAIQYFIQAMQESDEKRALELYDNCIKLDDQIAEAYNNRGYLRYRKGEIDGAKEDFENAIVKKEYYSEAYNNLGVLLFSQKHYNEAEKNFNLAGEYAEAKLNLGLLKYTKGEKDAVDYFNKAIELKPNFAEAYYIRGLYNLDTRLFLTKVVEDYLKAKDYKPNVIEAYPNRNLLTGEMKEWDNSYNGVEFSRDLKKLIRVPKDKEGIFKIPYNVTQIGYEAFWGCTSLTSIEIPYGVTEIGNEAFLDCISLTSIKIPYGVTEIIDYTFRGCSSLTSIEIPNSVTWIGHGAFWGCTSLASIKIPDSVTNIIDYAFCECISLTSIEIPDNVEWIGRAFYGCIGIKKYEVSNNNLFYCSIEGALYSKNKARLIHVPNNRVSFKIPNSVTAIGDWAFELCTSLASIEIPNSVTAIGDWAFELCTSLASIEIPNSVKKIGVDAFFNCTNLNSIVIPGSVTEIGDGAFIGCDSLTEIHLKHVSPVDFSGAFANLNLSEISVYVPKGSVEVYKNDPFYKQFKVKPE